LIEGSKEQHLFEYFVTLKMSLLSLWMNLTRPYLIKLFMSY